MLRERVVFVGFAVALGCVVTGCGASRVLISQHAVGDRVVRYTMSPSEEGEGLYDVHLQACRVDDTGAERECRETLVLRNVQPQSVY